MGWKDMSELHRHDVMDDEEYRGFLIECWKENLAHLRHVENERLTFFSIFLVGIGMILTLATSFSPFVSILLTMLMYFLNYISYQLVKRWNDVFDAHNRIAKRLLLMIDNFDSHVDDPYKCCKCEPGHAHHLNFYYYFDNKAGVAALLEQALIDEQNSPPQPKPPRKSFSIRRLFGKRYIRTGTLFIWFNELITVMLFLFMVISILELFGINI